MKLRTCALLLVCIAKINLIPCMNQEQMPTRKIVTACILGSIGMAAGGYLMNHLAHAPLSTRDKVFLGCFASATYSYFLKEIIKDVRPHHEKVALAGLLAIVTVATVKTTLLANSRMLCS